MDSEGIIKMKNNKLLGGSGFVLLLGVMLMIGSVSALSVSVPYMEEIDGVRTYQAYENNAEDFEIVLQNGGGTDPINVVVDVTTGSDVLQLMDENNIFLVVPGQKVVFFARGLISFDGRNTFASPEGFLCNYLGLPLLNKDQEDRAFPVIWQHPGTFKTDGGELGRVGSLFGWINTNTQKTFHNTQQTITGNKRKNFYSN